jgi:hypothetical protein
MLDLWALVNLVAYVTTWSNRNCYFKVAQDDNKDGRSLRNQEFIPGVEEQIRHRRDFMNDCRM